MSDASKQQDWTKPAAMAIPKGGLFKDKVEQGRYGLIFPKSPACYGFTISRRSSRDARRLSAPMGRPSKTRSPASPMP